MKDQANLPEEYRIAEPLLTEAERKQLKDFRGYREEQATEALRPRYHFTAPKGALNDPNGLCYWKGYWHLFYQNNPEGTGYLWGHAVSRDLLRWKDLPLAVFPTGGEKACWSGMVMVEAERAVAVYYSLGRGIVIAVSADPMLLHWEKLNGGEPVIPSDFAATKEYGNVIYDPCIWKKGNTYCVLSGKFTINPHSGTRERQEFLFESEDLVHWNYRGLFLENDLFALSDDDGACPYFIPCGDRWLLFHFSHHSGPNILVGSYDAERNRFIIEGGRHQTSSSSHFGGLLAPSAFAGEDGKITLIHNVCHCCNPNGNYQLMSLPRRVRLIGKRKNEVAVDVAEEAETLRVPGSRTVLENVPLEANREYFPEGVLGDTMEVDMTFEAKNIPMVEIKVMMSEDGSEYSAIRVWRQRGNTYLPTFSGSFGYRQSHETVAQLDTAHSTLCGNVRVPDEQSFWLAPEEPLNVRVFLDRSVVEVFVNGTVSLAARVSPVSGENRRFSMTACGDDLKLEKLESYQLCL